MSLDLIRRKHKWLTRIVLFFISATFIFGIGYFTTDFGSFTGGATESAAKVNGENVSFTEFYLQRNSIVSRLREQGISDPSTLGISDAQIDASALENSIDLKLLAQKARELGFIVSDKEVNELIHSNPSFQSEGKFIGTENYKNFIKQALNMMPEEFEQYTREQTLAQRLLEFIERTAIVSDAGLLNSYKNQNEKTNLYYIAFSGDDFTDSHPLADDEIENYYKTHTIRFMTPELRAIRYLIITPEIFEARAEVSDEEIRAYYNAYPEEFTPEDEGATKSLSDVKDEIKSELKKQRGEQALQELLDAINKGASGGKTVDTTAQENGIKSISESPLFSASEILDGIPHEISKRSFKMKKGETAFTPIETSVWVVEVKKITPPREKSLDESKEEIIALLKKQNTRTAVRQKAEETLTRLKKIKKEALLKEATALGLELKETGFFTRGESISEIGVENLSSEAFDIDEALSVSNKLYSSGNDFYIVSIKERQSAKIEEFEQEKYALEEQELFLQKRDVTQNWLEDMRREAEIRSNDELFSNRQ